jgi:hypothetical protein
MISRLRTYLPLLPVLIALTAIPAVTVATAANGEHDRDHDRNRTVRVNCARGHSLQRAIDRVPDRIDPLVVEVRGFCQGPIQIRRPLVIRGTDPAVDGITAPVDGNMDGQAALVEVFDVPGLNAFGPNGVQLESLGIQNSPGIGLLVTDSALGIVNVEIRNGAQDGVFLSGSAILAATDSAVLNNTGNGVTARGGRLQCLNCDINGNGATGDRWGVNAMIGSSIVLNNSTVIGRNGVRAQTAEVVQNGGQVNALVRANQANRGGHLTFQNNVQVTGDVWCSAESSITSQGQGPGTFGLNQLSTSPGSFNFMNLGCAVGSGVPGTTNFAGMTRFGPDAHVSANNGATMAFQQLDCYAGGTATWVVPGVITVNSVPGVPASCQP